MSSLTDCGLLHIIVGDPDYEIEDGQIQYSAARRSQERTLIEKRVADSLTAREARCVALQKRMADNQAEALRCRAVRLNPQASPMMRQQALTRADRLIKDTKQAAGLLNRERSLMMQGKVVLDRLSVAASGATDTEYLADVGQLASHIAASPKQIETLDEVTDKLEDTHEQFREYDSMLGTALERLERSSAAETETIEFGQAAVDESAVMAELDAMFQSQQFENTMAAASTTGRAAATTGEYEEIDLYMPPVPIGSLRAQPQRHTAVALTSDGQARPMQTRRTNFSDLRGQ